MREVEVRDIRQFVEVEMFTYDYDIGELNQSEGIVKIHKEHKGCYDSGKHDFFQECLACNYWVCGSHEDTNEQYPCFCGGVKD